MTALRHSARLLFDPATEGTERLSISGFLPHLPHAKHQGAGGNMSDTEIIGGYRFGPAAGGKPEQLVVLLHGLGADGKDLIGLAPELARALPHALFLSPDAPFPCDMAPYGRQWFSLQSRAPETMLAGIKTAAPILNRWLDAMLRDAGLNDADLALVGFSQGTMMSLYVGPRRAGKIAGILGYSGALIWEQDLDFSTLRKPPVRLIHGDSDTIVPMIAHTIAVDTLTRAGFTVSGGVTKGLPHSIDAAGIASGIEFLREIFARP